MLMSQLTKDREELDMLINIELKGCALADIKDFSINMDDVSNAIVDGNAHELVSNLVTSDSGSVLTIASNNRYYQLVDVSIPLVGELKEAYLNVALGQHLLDTCRLFIKHPNMF